MYGALLVTGVHVWSTTCTLYVTKNLQVLQKVKTVKELFAPHCM